MATVPVPIETDGAIQGLVRLPRTMTPRPEPPSDIVPPSTDAELVILNESEVEILEI